MEETVTIVVILIVLVVIVVIIVIIFTLIRVLPAELTRQLRVCCLDPLKLLRAFRAV